MDELNAALTKACERDELEIVRSLLRRGANPNVTVGDAEDDDSDWSLLMVAISSGREDIVELLLQQGADCNHSSRNGTCAVALAVEKRNLQLVEKLHELGCRETGRAILYAIQQGEVGLCRKLALMGANLEVVGTSSDGLVGGYTPLLLAVSKRTQALKDLRCGWLPDEFRARAEASLPDRLEIIRMLLEAGAKVSHPFPTATASDGSKPMIRKTALEMAADARDEELFATLLAHGSQPVGSAVQFAKRLEKQRPKP